MNTFGVPALVDLDEEYRRCARCSLCNSRKNVVFGSGSEKGPIMIVGEAPGALEDEIGEPFVGESGMLLMSMLELALPRTAAVEAISSIEDEEEYWETLRDYLDSFIFWTNLVLCRPPENRDPSRDEIKACRDRLHRTIYAVDPAVIIGVGKNAASALLGKKIAVTNESGTIYDVEVPSPVTGKGIRYPMMALVHPSWLLRQGDQDLIAKKKGRTYEAIQANKNLFEILKNYFANLGETFPPEE